MPLLRGLLIAITVTILAGPAMAWHHRCPAHVARWRGRAVAVSPATRTYPAGGWQAEAIARATARMQAAPGVTNELSPDAKETATGGPSGGVPEFSDN